MNSALFRLVLSLTLTGFALLPPVAWAQVQPDVLVFAPNFDSQCYSYSSGDSSIRQMSATLNGMQEYLNALGFSARVITTPLAQGESIAELMQAHKVTVFLSCSDAARLSPEQRREVVDAIGGGHTVIVDAFKANSLVDELGFTVLEERFEVETTQPHVILPQASLPSQYYSPFPLAEFKNAYLFDESEAVLTSKGFQRLPYQSQMYYLGPQLEGPLGSSILVSTGADDVNGGVLFTARTTPDSNSTYLVTGCFFCMNPVMLSSLLEYLPDKEFDFPEVSFSRLLDPPEGSVYVGNILSDSLIINFDPSSEFDRINITYTTNFVCSSLKSRSIVPNLISDNPPKYVVEYEVLDAESSECSLPAVRVSMEAPIEGGTKTLRREYVLPPKKVTPLSSTSLTEGGNGKLNSSGLLVPSIAVFSLVLLAIAYYFKFFTGQELNRDRQIRDLTREKERISDMMNSAKQQWYKRTIDDATFKDIFESNTKRMLEVNAELKQLGYTEPVKPEAPAKGLEVKAAEQQPAAQPKPPEKDGSLESGKV